MQQDIPLESSELLAFTPECLKALDRPPIFYLRAVTTREKRFRQRIHAEEGAIQHSDEAIRDEVLNGLKADSTSEEGFAAVSAMFRAYWEALDAFNAQSVEDPTLKFEYDPEVVRKIEEASSKMGRSWRPLARMVADINDYNRIEPLAYASVTVKRWQNLDVERVLDREYITLDCAEAIADELIALDREAGAQPGAAWRELMGACLRRFYLRPETEKNSKSPSPSETSRRPSKATSARGKSRSPANSKKTQSVS